MEKEQVCLLYNKHRKNTAIKCSRWLAALAFLPNFCQDFCPYLALSSSHFFSVGSGECSFCRLYTKFDRLEVLVWHEDVNDHWIPAGLHHTDRRSTDRAQTLTPGASFTLCSLHSPSPWPSGNITTSGGSDGITCQLVRWSTVCLHHVHRRCYWVDLLTSASKIYSLPLRLTSHHTNLSSVKIFLTWPFIYTTTKISLTLCFVTI